jgi:hypothetical protein
MEVEYPIAMDNDFAVWSAFGNQAWPALYFIDAQGRIRHHHFGEEEYERSERVTAPALANVILDQQGFGRLPEDDFVGNFAADVAPAKAKVMHAAQSRSR